MATDVHLQYVRAPLRELTNRVLAVRHRWLDRMLVNQTIASAAERQREHRHDWRAGAQRERSNGRRRRGRTFEEVDVHGVGSGDVLIDQNRDAVLVCQRSHHLADRSLSVDDRVPGARPYFLEQHIQPWVVQRPCEDADGLEPKRMGHRVEFPVTEVACDEEHSLTLAVCETNAFLAVEVDAFEHLLWRERAEFQKLEEQAAEVSEDGAHNRPPFRGGSTRKRRGDVLEGDAAMRDVEQVENKAEGSTAQHENRVRQNAGDPPNRHDRDVLQSLSHRICPRSHARNSSAGSTAETSGTDAIGRSDWIARASAGSRTASLSVVSTIAARAFRAAA